MVAKAPPDGYTFAVFNIGHLTSALLAKTRRINPARDFAPVSQIATGTLMLGLNAGVPTTTSKSRAAPGSLACMHHLVALISPITSAITLFAIASSSCAVRF